MSAWSTSGSTPATYTTCPHCTSLRPAYCKLACATGPQLSTTACCRSPLRLMLPLSCTFTLCTSLTQQSLYQRLDTGFVCCGGHAHLHYLHIQAKALLRDSLPDCLSMMRKSYIEPCSLIYKRPALGICTADALSACCAGWCRQGAAGQPVEAVLGLLGEQA